MRYGWRKRIDWQTERHSRLGELFPFPRLRLPLDYLLTSTVDDYTGRGGVGSLWAGYCTINVHHLCSSECLMEKKLNWIPKRLQICNTRINKPQDDDSNQLGGRGNVSPSFRCPEKSLNLLFRPSQEWEQHFSRGSWHRQTDRQSRADDKPRT